MSFMASYEGCSPSWLASECERRALPFENAERARRDLRKFDESVIALVNATDLETLRAMASNMLSPWDAPQTALAWALHMKEKKGDT